MKIGEETEKIEFKKSTGERRESMEAICCILNKHCGGELYYGVDDNGEVIGQTISDSTIRDVAALIQEAIEPKVTATIEKLTFEGKDVLKVSFSGHRRPYAVFGDFLTRVGTTRKKMSAEELKRLFECDDYSSRWEDEPSGRSLNDLDDQTMRTFFEKAKSTGRIGIESYNKAKVLSSIGLLGDTDVPNGAYALFGKKAPIHLKLATYASSDKVTFLDLKMRTGNIFSLLDSAVDYITQRLNFRVVIGAKGRTEVPEIPIRAIREIVSNAFAHASYEHLPEMEINVHPDKIEVYNPGSFPDEYTPFDFVKKNIHSYKRNGKILDALYMSKNCEKSGTGFQRVASLCSEAKVRWDFNKEANGFSFFLFRGEANCDRETKEAGGSMSLIERQVFDQIRTNFGTKIDQIAKELGRSRKTIQRAIGALIQYGAIRRVGSDKNGYWVATSEEQKTRNRSFPK